MFSNNAKVKKKKTYSIRNEETAYRVYYLNFIRYVYPNITEPCSLEEESEKAKLHIEKTRIQSGGLSITRYNPRGLLQNTQIQTWQPGKLKLCAQTPMHFDKSTGLHAYVQANSLQPWEIILREMPSILSHPSQGPIILPSRLSPAFPFSKSCIANLFLFCSKLLQSFKSRKLPSHITDDYNILFGSPSQGPLLLQLFIISCITH